MFPKRIEFKSSKILYLILLSLHAWAIAVTVTLALVWLYKCALIFFILGSLGYQLLQAKRRMPQAITWLRDGSVMIFQNHGQAIAAKLHGQTLRTTFLIILVLKCEGRKRLLTIPLFKDVTSKDEFRQLYVLLGQIKMD